MKASDPAVSVADNADVEKGSRIVDVIFVIDSKRFSRDSFSHPLHSYLLCLETASLSQI